MSGQRRGKSLPAVSRVREPRGVRLDLPVWTHKYAASLKCDSPAGLAALAAPTAVPSVGLAVGRAQRHRRFKMVCYIFLGRECVVGDAAASLGGIVCSNSSLLWIIVELDFVRDEFLFKGNHLLRVVLFRRSWVPGCVTVRWAVGDCCILLVSYKVT
jgi:hypothetical protein